MYSCAIYRQCILRTFSASNIKSINVKIKYPHYGAVPVGTIKRRVPLTVEYYIRQYTQSKDQSLDDESRLSIYRSTGKISKSAETVRWAMVGGLLIVVAKMGVAICSGSSSMFAEGIHSFVDAANQGFLMIGLRVSSTSPDKIYQYGYGKGSYIWSLLGALNITFFGAAAAAYNGVSNIGNMWISNTTLPELDVGLGVWSVLIFSFIVDGTVLWKSIHQINENRPSGVSFLQHLKKVRDPVSLAILLEDAASCMGCVIAASCIGLSQALANPIYDSLGGVVVGGLLASVGVFLFRLNYGFLMGKAVDDDIVEDICNILAKREGINEIKKVQTQFLGPYNFGFKAEIDFDTVYLNSSLLPKYLPKFTDASLTNERLSLLLRLHAEDISRAIEREIKASEKEIREKYPEAVFIELEPDSNKTIKFAIDDLEQAQIVVKERKKIEQMMQNLPSQMSIANSSNKEE